MDIIVNGHIIIEHLVNGHILNKHLVKGNLFIGQIVNRRYITKKTYIIVGGVYTPPGHGITVN